MSSDHDDSGLLRPPEEKKLDTEKGAESAEYRESEDDSAVWTSAERIPYESALPPAIQPPAVEVSSKPTTAKAESGHEGPGEKVFQFRRFMEDLSSMEQPAVEVMGLSRFAHDEAIVAEAVAYLGEIAGEHVVRGQLLEELIYAMAGAVHLRAIDSRPVLESMVRRALEQLESAHALPQLEEHFALAAMEGLKGQAFVATDLFDEYDAMVGQTADAMDREGEEAASALVAYHAGRYRERIRDILGMTPAPRAVDAVLIPPAEAPTASTHTPSEPAVIATPQTQKIVPQVSAAPAVHSAVSEASSKPYSRASAPARQTLQIEPELYEGIIDDDFAPSAGNLPWFMSVCALMAGGSGLAFSILSYKLGMPYLVIGLFWIAGAIGLVTDRKPGFFLGIATFLINGAFLIWSAVATELPAWLAPIGLMATGGIAIMVGLILLHPSLRARFQQTRW